MKNCIKKIISILTLCTMLMTLITVPVDTDTPVPLSDEESFWGENNRK